MIVIKTRGDIDELRRNHKINLIPKNHSRISAQFESLIEEENENISKKLNKYYYSCGCGEGTIFLITGVAIIIIYMFWAGVSNLQVAHVIFGLLFLFIISTIGKITGLLFAKYRLNKLLIIVSDKIK